MATFGALRHPWNRLLHPYRTHVLCPLNLCPNLCLKAKVAGLLSPQNRYWMSGQRCDPPQNRKRRAFARFPASARIWVAEHCQPFGIPSGGHNPHETGK